MICWKINVFKFSPAIESKFDAHQEGWEQGWGVVDATPIFQMSGLASPLDQRQHATPIQEPDMPTPAIFKHRQACIDLIGEDETLLFADGHDDAILGIAERDGVPLVVYDVRKLIHLLRTREGMSSEEAEEFFDYNIAGSHMGEQSPIFVRRIR